MTSQTNSVSRNALLGIRTTAKTN